MKNTYKLNIRYLICFLSLFFILLLTGRVFYMMLQGQVSVEDEEVNVKLLPILLGLPVSSYLFSFVVMLRQYIVHKGNALTLTERGIENTLTFTVILAFVFVLPVKCIPWSAIKSLDDSEGFFHIRIKTGMAQTSKLAKGILWIRGYRFCYKFMKPEVTGEDINLFYTA